MPSAMLAASFLASQPNSFELLQPIAEVVSRVGAAPRGRMNAARHQSATPPSPARSGAPQPILAAAMQQLDRKARTERAKELGRAAYRLGRDGEIVGYLASEGEDKLLREYHRSRLVVELWRPKGPDAPLAEFSRLRVRYDWRLVLELRWSLAGAFRIKKFERGQEWERELVARAHSQAEVV